MSQATGPLHLSSFVTTDLAGVTRGRSLPAAASLPARSTRKGASK